MNECHIADNTCKADGFSGVLSLEVPPSQPDQLRMQMLEHAVIVLNEANHKAAGLASYMHWPLIYNGDPRDTCIECFMTKQTPTTNILGVLNGILAFTDSSGFHQRITYSVEDARYSIQQIRVEPVILKETPVE